MAAEEHKVVIRNPWDDWSLLDHVDAHTKRLDAYAILVEIMADKSHPANDELRMYLPEVLPRLLLEEGWRAGLIEHLVEEQHRAAADARDIDELTS